MNSPLKPRYKGARYAKAWTYMVRNTRVSMPCRFFLVLLRTFCSRAGNQCWPSEATLAEFMEVSDRQIRRYCTEAKKAGLLSTKPRFPGQRKGLIFTLLDEDEAYRLQLCASPKGNKRTYMSNSKRTPMSTDQDVHEISSRTQETLVPFPLQPAASAEPVRYLKSTIK